MIPIHCYNRIYSNIRKCTRTLFKIKHSPPFQRGPRRNETGKVVIPIALSSILYTRITNIRIFEKVFEYYSMSEEQRQRYETSKVVIPIPLSSTFLTRIASQYSNISENIQTQFEQQKEKGTCTPVNRVPLSATRIRPHTANGHEMSTRNGRGNPTPDPRYTL